MCVKVFILPESLKRDSVEIISSPLQNYCITTSVIMLLGAEAPTRVWGVSHARVCSSCKRTIKSVCEEG